MNAADKKRIEILDARAERLMEIKRRAGDKARHVRALLLIVECMKEKSIIEGKPLTIT